MRRLVATTAVFGAIILSMARFADTALANDRRVALVIGNSSYQNVAQLPNPARDAGAVGQLLKDAHFDSVDVQLNLGIVDFKRTIRDFRDKADQADIAVVYYAGHGLEVSGINYLIPVDARLANDRDAEDEAVPLDRVLSSAGGAKKLRLTILDACRDNPFKAGMKRDRRSLPPRAISTLGGVDLSTTTDTLTAYASKLGSTAEDGDGEHSPFTAALLKSLTVPGLDVRMAFGRIKKEVMAATHGQQEPFVYGSLGDDNYALVPAPAVSEPVPTSEMQADYDLIAAVNTRRAWEAFLRRYNDGPYADKARQQLASLVDQVPPAAVDPRGNPSATSVRPIPPNVIAPGKEPSSAEAADWDKVKDSTDPVALHEFADRYPNSPLSIKARQRINTLKPAAKEHEDTANAKPAGAATASGHKHEDDSSARSKPESREARREPRREARPTQQAAARPSAGSHAVVGVGF
jgi:hypothetical protein